MQQVGEGEQKGALTAREYPEPGDKSKENTGQKLPGRTDVDKSSGVYLDGWMSMGVRSGFCGEVSTEVIQGQTESQLACHQRPQREQLVSTGLLRAMDGMAVLSYTERVTAVNPA